MSTENTNVSEKKFITQQELAAMLNVSLQTVGRYRRRGVGPPWLRLPGKGPNSGIRYDVELVQEWLEDQMRTRPRADDFKREWTGS